MASRNWNGIGKGSALILAGLVWMVVNNDIPRQIVLAIYGPAPGNYARQLELMNKVANVHIALELVGALVVLIGVYMVLRNFFRGGKQTSEGKSGPPK